MSAMTTSAPARARVSAWARPSPRDPPVTSATRPERSTSIATRHRGATRQEDLAANHQPLDLRRALVDLEQRTAPRRSVNLNGAAPCGSITPMAEAVLAPPSAPATRSWRWLAAPLLAFAVFSLTAGLLARHQPRSKGYF